MTRFLFLEHVFAKFNIYDSAIKSLVKLKHRLYIRVSYNQKHLSPIAIIQLFMRIKQFFMLIVLSVCLISCNNHSFNWETILAVETYIEEKPDSALTILENIDMQTLQGKEEKAKYALLYSMALDKNYIDKRDFKIIQPAIDYYKENGTATEKLRTHYYQGRIFHNQNKLASAMECYVKAIEYEEWSDDTITKARIYTAQGSIHYDLYEWDEYIESNRIAALYYKEAKRIDSYTRSLIRIISGYTHKNDPENALRYIQECKQFSSSFPADILSYFHATQLIYTAKYCGKQEVIDAINEYVNTVPAPSVDWVTISYAYCEIGLYNDALLALSQHKRGYSNISKEKSLIVTAEANKHLGNHQIALEAFEEYMALQQNSDFAVYTQDAKFVKERHELELRRLKEQQAKNIVLFLSTIFIVLSFAVIAWVRSRQKINRMQRILAEQELEEYRIKYEQIQEERDNLTELLEQNKELEAEVKSAVCQRLELLNKFFTAYITKNSDIDKKANLEMEELLANKDTFMISTKHAFAGSHPEFIKYLEEHGLTEWEISYCCLYALGLKGKEVGTYMRMRSHYNISSAIREKLGINEHDTNLGIYIRKLLKSSE